MQNSAPGPRTVTNNSSTSPITIHMDLGNVFCIIPILDLIPFLDDPEPNTIVLNAEGIARPSSVCLPYALIPGIDISSSAYQKAVTILTKKPDATALLATLPTFDAKLSNANSGMFLFFSKQLFLIPLFKTKFFYRI